MVLWEIQGFTGYQAGVGSGDGPGSLRALSLLSNLWPFKR